MYGLHIHSYNMNINMNINMPRQKPKVWPFYNIYKNNNINIYICIWIHMYL